jgi:predicted dehydrogenase
MTDRLRWGIAAPGSIADQMATALSTLDDAEIVAVGSRSPERAAEFAERHAIPRSYGNYYDLYADPDVDIVYVASPHSAHRDMTVAALESGKHVLCEKAFAMNAAEARQMVETARRRKRFLMEALWTWFLPPIIDVRRRVAAGEIGEIRVVQANFGVPVLGEVGRHRELAQGGGALLDMGIYPVMFTRLMLGAPDAVRAIGRLGPTGVDANVGIVLGHPSGALGVLHTGLDALTPLTAEIIGTGGIISVDAPFWFATGFTVNRHNGRPEKVSMPHQGLAHEAAHAMDRIRAGHLESDILPLDTSVSVMETLDEVRAQIGLRYPAHD